MKLADLVDATLEFPIAPSFTRVGCAIRRRVAHWDSLDGIDLEGRTVVVTGATSGIGLAAARRFAAAGADLVVVGRSSERNRAVVEELRLSSGNESVGQFPADMGDLGQVRALAARMLDEHERLDVLVHNAGALSAERAESPEGTEATVASQVVGPFLLTSLVLDRLTASAPSRVITMSSGGMYSARLDVAGLQMSPGAYKGAEQYARAKRVQVTLNEMWADRFGERGVRFHALHPGWADTPGVAESLPRFGRILGPLLRTPDQGADTLVWLASAAEPLEHNGLFWHDRRPRPIHRLRSTKDSDTPGERSALWRWVVEAAGAGPA